MEREAGGAGRRVASNAGYLGLLTLSNYVLGLVIYPFLSRVFSVEAFGVFGFSLAFVSVFQVVVEYGFMISTTAKIAKARSSGADVGRLVSTTMLAKSWLALGAILCFALSVFVVPLVRENLVVLSAALCSAIAAAMLPDFYFRGIERMRWIAVRTLLCRGAALVLMVFLVRGDADLVLAPTSLGLGNGLAVVMAFLSIRRDGIGLPRPTALDAMRMIRESSGFFASRVAVSINQAAGAMVLGLKYDAASSVMGEFAGASRIASAGDLAVMPVSDALYPHMVRTGDFRLFRRVYLGGLGVWFVGCGGVFLWANDLCVLVLGENFAESGRFLRILVVGTFMAYSSSLFGYAALTPMGLAGHANLALVVATLGNLVIYGCLWASGTISPEAVCGVMAFTNFVVFGYRWTIFCLNGKARRVGFGNGRD